MCFQFQHWGLLARQPSLITESVRDPVSKETDGQLLKNKMDTRTQIHTCEPIHIHVPHTCM